MRRLLPSLATLVLCTALAPAASAQVRVEPAPAATAPASIARPAGLSVYPPLPTDYARFTQGATKQPGLFTLWRKDGRVYLEIRDDQFNKDFVMNVLPANGLAGFGVYPGDVWLQEARMVRFERDGRRISMLWPQTRIVADAGTPLADAVKQSTADSIVGLLAPAVEDRERKVTIVDLSIFLTDVLNFGEYLSSGNPLNPFSGYHLDPTKSYFGPSKSFEKNVIIEADQGFVSARAGEINTVPDERSILMRIKYQLSEPPDPSQYMSRFGDERVGFWTDPHIDLSHDNRRDPVLHDVLRWNVQPSDPTKRPSPAKQPIVYTLANTIPVEYRQAVRDGLLEWNKAFERIGISDVVKVQDQPNDPAWDPDDIRYNVVNWVATVEPDFVASTQIVWDPRDGQIFRSGIAIDASVARLYKQQRAFTGAGTSPAALANGSVADPMQTIEPLTGSVSRAALASSEASYERGEAQEAGFGAAALTAMGYDSLPASYIHDVIKQVAMHETGHTFGLAHNFIAHSAYTNAQLRDRKFTERNGTTASVMDYNPINLWPKGSSNGTLFQTTIGPYDYHAIAWGYQVIPTARTPFAETPQLNAWAAQSNDPLYRFRGDEDVLWNGHAVDPRVSTFMLSNDSVGWCQGQLNLTDSLISSLDRRFPRAGQPWEDERDAFSYLMLDRYYGCSSKLAHFMAAEYTSTARPGDPHATDPLTPVPRAAERRAYDVIARYLFSDQAFHYSPQTLRRLVYTERQNFADIGYDPTLRHDVPIAQLAALLQNSALSYMFSPVVLQRLADMPMKAKPGETMTMTDLFTWTQAAIYGDLSNGRLGTSQIHRNLQRRYARFLRALSNLQIAPYDAQALARHELVSLNGTVARALRSNALDVQTRAHLEAMQVDVQRGIEAKGTVPV